MVPPRRLNVVLVKVPHYKKHRPYKSILSSTRRMNIMKEINYYVKNEIEKFVLTEKEFWDAVKSWDSDGKSLYWCERLQSLLPRPNLFCKPPAIEEDYKFYYSNGGTRLAIRKSDNKIFKAEGNNPEVWWSYRVPQEQFDKLMADGKLMTEEEYFNSWQDRLENRLEISAAPKQ